MIDATKINLYKNEFNFHLGSHLKKGGKSCC